MNYLGKNSLLIFACFATITFISNSCAIDQLTPLPDFELDTCSPIPFENADFELRESSIYLRPEFFEPAYFVLTRGTLEEYYTSIPPEFDLNAYVYIFVSRGSFSTGGYKVEISDVCKLPNQQIIVVVELIDPEPGQAVTDAITNPQTMVKVKLSSWYQGAPVTFVDTYGNSLLE